jgi:hypothetical protein
MLLPVVGSEAVGSEAVAPEVIAALQDTVTARVAEG